MCLLNHADLECWAYPACPAQLSLLTLPPLLSFALPNHSYTLLLTLSLLHSPAHPALPLLLPQINRYTRTWMQGEAPALHIMPHPATPIQPCTHPPLPLPLPQINRDTCTRMQGSCPALHTLPCLPGHLAHISPLPFFFRSTVTLAHGCKAAPEGRRGAQALQQAQKKLPHPAPTCHPGRLTSCVAHQLLCGPGTLVQRMSRGVCCCCYRAV